MVAVSTGVGVVFWLSSYFRNLSEIEKICVVFIERSQKCESVILVPPLQSKEGFFCSDPYSLFHTMFTPRSHHVHTTFKPGYLSVQDGYIVDINFMSARNYVFEDY